MIMRGSKKPPEPEPTPKRPIRQPAPHEQPPAKQPRDPDPLFDPDEETIPDEEEEEVDEPAKPVSQRKARKRS